VLAEERSGVFNRGENPHAPTLHQFCMTNTNTDEETRIVEQTTTGSTVFGDLGRYQKRSVHSGIIQLEPEEFHEPSSPTR
jgi:hypothetical protein